MARLTVCTTIYCAVLVVLVRLSYGKSIVGCGKRYIKQLVAEKKLQVWNKVVHTATSDYKGNKNEFWAFVSRRTKGKKKGIVALRNSAGVSVTSTKGKLEVLTTYYRHPRFMQCG